MITAKASFERTIGNAIVVVKFSVEPLYGHEVNNTDSELHVAALFTGLSDGIGELLNKEQELEEESDSEASGAGFEDEDDESPFTGCGDPNCCRG